VPFLRNLGWRVGASIVYRCEFLAEECRIPLLSGQYASLGADARSQSEKDACSGTGAGSGIQSQKQQSRATNKREFNEQRERREGNPQNCALPF
jgi:hypothetical protein